MLHHSFYRSGSSTAWLDFLLQGLTSCSQVRVGHTEHPRQEVVHGVHWKVHLNNIHTFGDQVEFYSYLKISLLSIPFNCHSIDAEFELLL